MKSIEKEIYCDVYTKAHEDMYLKEDYVNKSIFNNILRIEKTSRNNIQYNIQYRIEDRIEDNII